MDEELKEEMINQEEMLEQDLPEEQDIPEEMDDRDSITIAKENFYDSLPFTYRQVDIFCKVAIGVLIAIFIYYGAVKIL